MTEALRTGVVGVGRLGAEHARILAALPGSRLVGVHDLDGERAAAVGARAGCPAIPELEALLDAADAVVVAVPTAAHFDVARAALEAGCHTLVEKPLTVTLAEADALIEAADRRSLQLSVGHVERFNGAILAAHDHLDGPRFIESLRLAPFQPRGTDVTVILDLMIHDLDLVLGLVGTPVASLNAVGVAVLTDSVDIANARLVFEDGAVADITASRVSHQPTRRLRLFQPSGYFSLDLARGEGEFHRRRPGVPISSPPRLSDVIERISLHGDGGEPLALELEAFLDAARGDRSRTVSAEEGRAALDLALQIGEQVRRFGDVPV